MGRSVEDGGSGMSWSEQWGAHNNSAGDAPFAKGTPIDPATGAGAGSKHPKLRKGYDTVKTNAIHGAEVVKDKASDAAVVVKREALKLKSGVFQGFKWAKEKCTKSSSK